MQSDQASGVDTKAMLPVLTGIFMIVIELFLPWFSMPVLKYSRYPVSYTLWKAQECLGYVQKSVGEGQKMDMPVFTGEELAVIGNWIKRMQILAIVLVVLLLIGAVIAYRKKKKGAAAVRLIFFGAAILPVMAFICVYQGNLLINRKMGRVSDFINVTIHSYLQLSAFPYAQFILAVLMVFTAKKLLDTKFEYEAVMYMERYSREDRKLGKRTKMSIFLILLAIPAMIFFGIFFLNDRSVYFISLCIIGLSMIPFCMVFEDRKPQAREILLVAVMAAIAVVGRMAFFMIPQTKPVTAVVIITGVSLGPEAGFLTGAVAAFVSNFFFGQGPWSPWQMFAFGIIGFLAGLIFRGERAKYRNNKFVLCTYGGLATLVIYGMLMDTASVTMFSGDFKWSSFMAMYISGFPFNVIHGVSTIVFLYFLAGPMNRKLDRIKKKYGIMEA